MSDWRDNKVIHWTLVLVVFACTGTTVARIDNYFTELLGYDKYSWVWWVGLVVLLPVYNVLLLCFGFIFGKFTYFREKQKKTWRRIFGGKAKQDIPPENNE